MLQSVRTTCSADLNSTLTDSFLVLNTPQDVQACGYLQQAMKVLDLMAIVWPSAGRAYDLLEAAQHNIEANRLTISAPQDASNERTKERMGY